MKKVQLAEVFEYIHLLALTGSLEYFPILTA